MPLVPFDEIRKSLKENADKLGDSVRSFDVENNTMLSQAREKVQTLKSNPVVSSMREKAVGALGKVKLMRNNSTNPEEGATLTVENDSQDDNDSTSLSSAASSRIEEFSEAYCPKLTFQQRLIGFGCSFGIGYMITFFSFRFFIELVEGNPIPFALNYTTGNVLALCSSTFLCGPARQFRNMLDDKRKYNSVTYLCCLFCTFVVVLVPMPNAAKLITLILLILAQFCASFWYTLSYIPFGRRTVSRILKRQLGLEE